MTGSTVGAVTKVNITRHSARDAESHIRAICKVYVIPVKTGIHTLKK